jgi:uncharacterized protein YndB with AHSA1/START domain
MQVTTPNETDLVLTRAFEAPRERVYEACTRPELLLRWFYAPGHVFVTCEDDQHAGGTYRWVVRAPDGTERTARGEYLEIAPPTRIATTERKDPAGPQGDAVSVVTLDLIEEPAGRTTLTCTVSYPDRVLRDKVVASGLTSADAEAYDRLAALLAAQ